MFFTRLGGDEFCLLLADRGDSFDKSKARALIEESLRGIGRKVGLDQDINVSTGFALIPESGITINDGPSANTTPMTGPSTKPITPMANTPR